MGFFDEPSSSEEDISKFLVDIPQYLNDFPLKQVGADPSLFTKDELAKRPGMEWLHGIECNLIAPVSSDLDVQKEQLDKFFQELKAEAEYVDQGFCPQVFPEGYREPVIALDTETTGLDTRVRYDYDGSLIVGTKLVGLCLSVSDTVGYYLPVLHTESDGVPNWTMELIIPFIDRIHQEFLVVYHYAQYDREVLALNGVTQLRPWPYFLDTLLLSVFYERGNSKMHGLKYLSEKHLGRKMIQIEQLFEDVGAVEKIKAKGKPVINFDRLSASVANVYASSDALITLSLYSFFKNKPSPETNVFQTQAVPLSIDHKNIDVLRNLYRNGLPINLDYCLYAIRDLTYRNYLLEQRIYEIVGKQFDISSPQQLSVILFDEFNIPALPDMERGKPTKKYPRGLYSTKEEVLEALNDKYPDYAILKYIVTYRKFNVALTRLFMKMVKNSYVDALLPFTKVKVSFSQSVIPTGRLSSESGGRGAERVKVTEHKNGKISYKYEKGDWQSGFNAQGVNNPFFRLNKVRRVCKLPEEAGIDLENPYPDLVLEKIVKDLAGKDK